MLEQAVDKAVRDYWEIGSDAQYKLEPIQQGASGRAISRVTYNYQSIIAIEYDDSRADNAQFAPLAIQLSQAGIVVPEIISHHDNNGCGYCLVQDLGKQTLLKSLEKIKQLDDSVLETVAIINLYQSAIDAIAKVHQLEISKIDAIYLQPSFGVELYRWEQEYFITHYGTSIGLSEEQQQAWLNQPALIALAEKLASQPRALIHRDCQSENIMLKQDSVYLIDFQGMRLGLPEYDWASLIYDPYVAKNLSPSMQQTLQAYLIKKYQINIDILQACALQRLMQATGAYAKLSALGIKRYQKYIEPTFKQLQRFQSLSGIDIKLKKNLFLDKKK